MKIRIITKKVRFALAIHFQILKNKSMIGISNRTQEGYYIPFIDYDGLDYDWVYRELRRLQLDFCLSEFYIFQSSKRSYHAVCFDKLTMAEYLNILTHSSCDPNFRNVPLKYGKKQWNLRLSAKEDKPPKAVGRVSPMNDLIYRKSLSHLTFFSKKYPDIHFNDSKNDHKQQNIYICEYKV